MRVRRVLKILAWQLSYDLVLTVMKIARFPLLKNSCLGRAQKVRTRPGTYDRAHGQQHFDEV